MKKFLEEAETEALEPTYSLRQGVTEATRVYEQKCIFCESSNKCLKGTSTRESLIQAVDLRADETLRNVATQNGDTKLLAITSRDIVAAEACYHGSCYKKYTKIRASTSNDSHFQEDDYKIKEASALQHLYKFIRVNLFSNPRIMSLIDLTSMVVSAMKDKGVENI